MLPTCEKEGCHASAVGMVVFQCEYSHHGVRTFPTWPWQWRCLDHSHRDALERDLTPQDLANVREQLERRVNDRLPLPLVGLSNLTVEQVAELRKKAPEGETERLPPPPPATFVSTREMEAILRGEVLFG